MKRFFETLVVILMLAVVWYAFPTHYVIKPLSIRYDGERFLLIRDVPYGPIWGRYVYEVRSELGQCHTTGMALYEDRGLSPVLFPVPDVQPCIPATGEVFVIGQQRMALIGGWLPMRPSSYSWSCVVGGTNCVLVSN